MLSKARTVLICRQCLLSMPPFPRTRRFLPSPVAHQQVRFVRQPSKLDLQMYPDHLKKVILGPSYRIDPETRKIFLKDIEAVRARNLVRLKGFSKGGLYQSSIHGKAEVVMETMRAWDRQAIQQLYAEQGILRNIPTANFYLARAYFILRNKGPWLKFRLTPELKELESGDKKDRARWTRFRAFRPEEYAVKDSGGSSSASTPIHVWEFNFRLFLRRMTSTKGSAFAREWATQKKDTRTTIQNQIEQMIEDFETQNPQSESAMFPKNDQNIARALEWSSTRPSQVGYEDLDLDTDKATKAWEKAERRNQKDTTEEAKVMVEERKLTPEEKAGSKAKEAEQWKKRQALDPADRQLVSKAKIEAAKFTDEEFQGGRAWLEMEEEAFREARYSKLREQGESAPSESLKIRNAEELVSAVGPSELEAPPVEIWKPNQQDPRSRSETFSVLPPNLAASLQKDINSEWTPHKWNEVNLFPAVHVAIQTVVLRHLPGSTLKLTDIQSLAIPALTKLDNENFTLDPKTHPEIRQSFLLAAETGTGKTLAYLAPLLNKLKREEAWGEKNQQHPRNVNERRRAAHPRAFIIVPTSELAEQIYGILKQLCHQVKFSVAGLLPKYSDRVVRVSFLAKPVDIYVSTPARLLEYIESRQLRTTEVSYVVIDEADSLFDRSFLPEVNAILSRVKEQLTHLVLVSATIPLALERLVRSQFPDMQRIVTPKIHSVPRRLDFSISVEEDKFAGLYQILRTIQEGDTQADADVKRAIIFCNHRERVKEVYEYISSQQQKDAENDEDPMLQLIPFTRENYDRHTALERFQKQGSDPDPELDKWESKSPRKDYASESKGLPLRVLITTDMASRGLDTISAKLVVLYDVPFSNIDLIHRLGRTARAGTRGRAVMFLSRKEAQGTIKTWINDVRDKIIRGQALV
jgi:ATP-dependent RNA helicase MRH4